MDKKDVMINELNKRIEQLNKKIHDLQIDINALDVANIQIAKERDELEKDNSSLGAELNFQVGLNNNLKGKVREHDNFINHFTDELILKILKDEDKSKLIEFIITSKKGAK